MSRVSSVCMTFVALLALHACDTATGAGESAQDSKGRDRSAAAKSSATSKAKPSATASAAPAGDEESADADGPMIVPVGTSVPEEVAQIAANSDMQKEPVKSPLRLLTMNLDDEDPIGAINEIMPVVGAQGGARALRSGEMAYAWGNGQWYRVSVVGAAGSHYSCSFIGHGVTASVHPSRLRTAAGQLVLAPGQAPAPTPPPPPAPKPQGKAWCGGSYGHPNNVHQWKCKHEDMECCKKGTCQIASCYRKCQLESVKGCMYIGCCLESAGPSVDF